MTSTVMDRSGRSLPPGRGRLIGMARLELGFEDKRLVRWIRRRAAWLRSPLGAMTFALAIAMICGILVHERCLAVAGGLGLVTGMGWYFPGVIARNARVRIDFETDRVTEGDEFALNVRIEPREAIPLVGLTIETGSHFGADDRDGSETGWSFALPAYWPWRQGMIRRQVKRRAVRRGIYRLDRARVACSFPFRLREARSKADSAGFLIVRPRVHPIRQWPEVTIGSDDFGQMTSPAKGTSGDTTGLREYRRGDDPRRIHWPQTARLGHLVMREQQRSTNPQMSVHLGPPAHYEGWEADWAVRLAASFLAGAAQLGWHCDLDLGEEAPGGRRRFHGRDTDIYLDSLACFGDAEAMAVLESDAASDEIPRERFRLSIVPGRYVGDECSSAQAVIVLGEIQASGAFPFRPWLHFRTAGEVHGWLEAQGATHEG